MTVGESRPDIGPVIGFRERKIAKAEAMLDALTEMLVISPVMTTLSAWQRVEKEIQIQKCYLQHESKEAV